MPNEQLAHAVGESIFFTMFNDLIDNNGQPITNGATLAWDYRSLGFDWQHTGQTMCMTDI